MKVVVNSCLWSSGSGSRWCPKPGPCLHSGKGWVNCNLREDVKVRRWQQWRVPTSDLLAYFNSSAFLILVVYFDQSLFYFDTNHPKLVSLLNHSCSIQHKKTVICCLVFGVDFRVFWVNAAVSKVALENTASNAGTKSTHLHFCCR